MASMAVYLRSRPKSLLRASAPVYSSSSRSHLSSSSPSSSPPYFSHGNPQKTENTQSNSRFLSDLKSHLRNRKRKPSQQPPRKAFSFSQGSRSPLNNPPAMSFDEIGKSLKEFRIPDTPISFQQLYKKHLKRTKVKDSLRWRPSAEDTNAAGTTEGLPLDVFGNELRECGEDDTDTDTGFVRGYSFDELGEKLRKLRPQGVNFSLSELNERLIKLREMEKMEQEPGYGAFSELRKTLLTIKKSSPPIFLF